ncbi:hypothetical protein LSTR_LSTR011568 [Laodelphax striatellus]|uniref:Uncharacterized protein n=1 Tax=Laodelphax striatellus TaxID=195883 RepID=A0A482X5Z4_LAOST|nr:hypothetical protein LSTR_LSTR011568 [Laodelphax striatellus]
MPFQTPSTLGLVLFSLALTSQGQRPFSDKKWVWGESQRSAFEQDRLRGEFSIAKPLISSPNGAAFNKQVPLFQVADNPRTDSKLFRDSSLKESRPRYQVFEGGENQGGLGEPIPSAASNFGQGNPGGLPPLLPPLLPSHQPPHHPLPPRPAPPPPNPANGVLTGPVPSWEQPPPPKNGDPTSFDSCKCVHSFNCKSPGLQFGSCDTGKQYCCTNNQGYGFQAAGAGGGGFGSKFGSNFGGNRDDLPAVLAGPGGPVDKIPGRFPPPPPSDRLPFDVYIRSNNVKKN